AAGDPDQARLAMQQHLISSAGRVGIQFVQP
ncbi:MAG: FadR family transcriptional regulator, partial [Rhodocyclaceae bacterium]|nr:FadR family transcriptional regulator [Rhodocyclaceae bacterium]